MMKEAYVISRYIE
jgi:tubulin polyglutamylase TTLL1